MSSSRSSNRMAVPNLLNFSDVDDSGPQLTRSYSEHPSVFELKCGIGKCNRRFRSPEALKSHQERSHFNTTQYICPICQSNFSTSPNLNKHIRSVHEKLKPYKCDKCPSTFSFRDALQRHQRMVHEKVRPFQCPICPQKFKAKAHLHKHCSSIHATSLSSSSNNPLSSVSSQDHQKIGKSSEH